MDGFSELTQRAARIAPSAERASAAPWRWKHVRATARCGQPAHRQLKPAPQAWPAAAARFRRALVITTASNRSLPGPRRA